MVQTKGMKSKDTSSKIGCVIVGRDHSPLSQGYNGIPRNCDDNVEERNERPLKYEWFEHAERNAIYNAARTGTSLLGSTLYITDIPCADCARGIIQSGIDTVIIDSLTFMDNKFIIRWQEKILIAIEMLYEAGISMWVFDNDKKIRSGLCNWMPWLTEKEES